MTLCWHDVDDGAGYPAISRHQLQGPTDGGHSHTFYEVVYVVEGFCLHVCNDTTSLLMSGDILALRPGDVHRYRGQRNVQIVNFLFMPEALSGLMDEVCALPGMADFLRPDGAEDGPGEPARRILHRHLSLEDRAYLEDFFETMQRERAQQQTGWMLRSKALLLDFMVFFARIFSARFTPQRGENAYVGYVTEALGIMEARYREDISIAGIAAGLGISADHLTRQFRQAMGITPIEYLRRFRFARAMELLRHQQPVGMVSRAVGFHHTSHFSREFKSLFTMTPSAFQRQARKRRGD